MVTTVVDVEGGVTLTEGDKLWKAALMWVRDHGLVPDSWVLDRTRRLYDSTGYATVIAGVDDLLDQVAVDPWKGQWPLLAVESEDSAAALEPTAIEYRSMVAPLRGQAGRAYLFNDVAPRMYDGQIVLAVVDLDKVGDDISASAQKRLEAQTGFTFDWRVIALTDAQVDAYGIVKVPRKDKRDGITRMVAETEALGAPNLRLEVRRNLDLLLPEPLIVARGQEEAKRTFGRRLGL